MDCFEELELHKEVLVEVSHLLWGSAVSEDVYLRWNQGFVFGMDEPTALLQYQGGPCAVIVPLQAYLLKNIMFSSQKDIGNWRQITGLARDEMLCGALADILCQIADTSSSHLKLCYLSQDIDVSSKGYEEFHTSLRCRRLSDRNKLVTVLQTLLDSYCGPYGLLLLLYSVLLTKSCNLVKSEMADAFEPLIDPVHGHGSQSLINLLLTGRATSHVWDNEKDVSGLKLQGISSRSDIGFLTLLEHLRYCEVGWYLKNPKFPIWLLGSETHLTLLFSEELSLVADEGQDQVMAIRRVFSRFDDDGRGFITSESLGELMRLLDLVCEPEYVKIMAEKLDPEQLGVITFNSFLSEFFSASLTASPEQAITSFTVYHYNGLARSPANKVIYVQGTCTISELPELQMMSDHSPIKTCLLTKWPTIELTWTDGCTPSII